MKNYSQSKQDLFVIKMLESKKNGTYIEIGGNEPIAGNNTYLLEKDFDWKGFSVELNPNLSNQYNETRNNVCYTHDALTFDFGSAAARMFGEKTQIDYLSLDIEPASQTFECLKRMPHNKYRFSVITFEHELYYEGPHIRDASRKYLADLGYQLVVGDVMCQGNAYEDWFVDPAFINESVWRPFCRNGVEDADLEL